MDQLTQSWIDAARQALEQLQQCYKVNAGMLLTEGDLECHMFHYLLQQEVLRGFHKSKDGLMTSFVHSQVTWFKTDRQSGFEVDLTISDPAKLEVKNIELFEEIPHKGYAYDGECVAIELKFLRKIHNALDDAIKDFKKLKDDLISAKLENINKGKYRVSNKDNIAFLQIVGCKTREIFEEVKIGIGEYISNSNCIIPSNFYLWLFCEDEIEWQHESMLQHYQENKVPRRLGLKPKLKLKENKHQN